MRDKISENNEMLEALYSKQRSKYWTNIPWLYPVHGDGGELEGFISDPYQQELHSVESIIKNFCASACWNTSQEGVTAYMCAVIQILMARIEDKHCS